jgi:lipopolysaccharide transport system ATP-binding protein
MSREMTLRRPVIDASGLGKVYHIGNAVRSTTLREALSSGAAAIWRKSDRSSVRHSNHEHELWAVRDISFTVGEGETVGLIGPNGSGKSTLLKIISRIVSPTTGRALIRGRVGALLEVGTGFHPELTGRENIFLNGALIGMSAADIRRRFDEIVEFSGMEEFLDLPIKRYSSGMAMRLAFAVAAHLEPDVLIIDEILAVGDAAFQQKCLGRMDQVSKSGCTVFFVSHNLAAVQRLCSRAILLEKGQMVADGPTAEVVSQYLAAVATEAEANCWTELPPPDRAHKGPHFTAVRYLDPSRPSQPRPRSMGPLRIEVRIESPRPVKAILAADISHELLGKLVNADWWTKGHQLAEVPAGASTWCFDIDAVYLEAGRYVIDLWLADQRSAPFDHRPMAVQMQLLNADGLPPDSSQPPQEFGIVPSRFRLTRENWQNGLRTAL